MKPSPEWLSLPRKSTLGGIYVFLCLLKYLTLHSNYSVCTAGAAQSCLIQYEEGGGLSLIECETTVAVKIPAAFSIWDNQKVPVGSDGLKYAPFGFNKSILGQDRSHSLLERTYKSFANLYPKIIVTHLSANWLKLVSQHCTFNTAANLDVAISACFFLFILEHIKCSITLPLSVSSPYLNSQR